MGETSGGRGWTSQPESAIMKLKVPPCQYESLETLLYEIGEGVIFVSSVSLIILSSRARE